MFKKTILLVTVFSLLLLCACSPKNKTKPNAHDYFELEDGYNEVYVKAADLYNTFLNGNSSAFDTQTEKDVPIDKFIKSGSGEGANQYVLFDINVDGSPELHFTGSTYAIFTVQDDRVLLVYSEPLKFEFHQLLSTPGIMAMQRSQGVTYRFVTLSKDNTVSITEFTDPRDTGTNLPFTFNGKTVTEEDWKFFTKPYFNQTKDTVAIPWNNYAKHH